MLKKLYQKDGIITIFDTKLSKELCYILSDTKLSKDKKTDEEKIKYYYTKKGFNYQDSHSQ
jgi:hypothetical protein